MQVEECCITLSSITIGSFLNEKMDLSLSSITIGSFLNEKMDLFLFWSEFSVDL